MWDAALDPTTIGDARIFHSRVSDFRTASPVTVELESEIDEVIELLLEHRVGALPVVDAEGTLAGIISYVDVSKAALGRF